MADGFLEVVFPLSDTFGIDERDEFEDWIEAALQGLAEVSGGGIGLGSAVLDIDILEAEDTEQVVAVLTALLQEHHAPAGSCLVLQQPEHRRIPIPGL